LVSPIVRPGTKQSRFVAVAEPVGDLFDGGLFEVVGEARGRRDVGAPRKKVAAGVRHAGERGGRRRKEEGERRKDGNDALAADEVLDAGLLGPAVGFVGFEFEFRDGFDGVTKRAMTGRWLTANRTLFGR